MITNDLKREFLRCVDEVTRALKQLDDNLDEGYDSQLLLPKLFDLHKAASPLASSMRPKPRKKTLKRSELSDMQKAVLERFRTTGSVAIYEGYGQFIRTAESLDRRGLITWDRSVYGLSSTRQYSLTELGRAKLDKMPHAPSQADDQGE